MSHPSYHQLVLDLEHDIGERRDISGLHEGGGEAARKGVVTDLWIEDAMQCSPLSFAYDSLGSVQAGRGGLSEDDMELMLVAMFFLID